MQLVDMTALVSDDPRSGGALRRQALKIDTFGEAAFRPVERASTARSRGSDDIVISVGATIRGIMDPLRALTEQGQSVWLDYIRRGMIADGELARLVDDGIRGVTSNPAIFEKAIAGSDDYDEALRDLLDAAPHASTLRRFETLAVEDVTAAADVLRVVYDTTAGADGFVSLEVSPRLAHDTQGTIAEARRLWEAVDRPNLMIKVPATPEGGPAIEELIAASINVNVTLIFSLRQYKAIAEAFIRGLERTEDPTSVASVASFFVSRVDTAVDRELETIGTREALALRGRIAVANSKLAYRSFQELFEGERFAALRTIGARPQRVLWASTGTKNPAYSDVLYVEDLIGPHTVNTMPPETLEAWLDHGTVDRATLLEGVDGAAAEIARLEELGIDLNTITDRLQADGVSAFADAFDRLLEALKEKAARLAGRLSDNQTLALGGFRGRVDRRLATWAAEDVVGRLWKRDHTLWSEEPVAEIENRLGWLDLPRTMHHSLDDLRSFAEEVRADGLRHVVLLGMGGSSLAPEVYSRTFGSWDLYPELIVADSTHPGSIRSIEDRIDTVSTLFLVSSKSGTTIEPLSLLRHFWEVVSAISRSPGRHFAAVTDPGAPLVELAVERGFRRVFEATPDVGGRYAALSHFGMVPAALIGADVHRLLDRAATMAQASAPPATAGRAPGFVLGAALGELAAAGRDKVTLAVSDAFAALPAWMEQLIAESLGKGGKGIVPVADEPLGPPEVYGEDRVFLSITLVGDDVHAEGLSALERAGHPVVRIVVDEPEDLASEMFRAQVAVATAGSIIGVHPFDQPDVQRAKELAQQALAGTLSSGEIPESPTGKPKRLKADLSRFFGQLTAGDYVALQAFVARTPEVERALSRIRMRIRDRFRVATTGGFGPRFLHSTGQLHKGGPASGAFIQFVDRAPPDPVIPGTGHTFADLVSGQADGDFQALRDAGRRVIRVRLGADVERSLLTMERCIARR